MPTDVESAVNRAVEAYAKVVTKSKWTRWLYALIAVVLAGLAVAAISGTAKSVYMKRVAVREKRAQLASMITGLASEKNKTKRTALASNALIYKRQLDAMERGLKEQTKELEIAKAEISHAKNWKELSSAMSGPSDTD